MCINNLGLYKFLFFFFLSEHYFWLFFFFCIDLYLCFETVSKSLCFRIASTFPYVDLFFFTLFFFLLYRVLGHGPYKFCCRFWARYPCGCFLLGTELSTLGGLFSFPLFFFFVSIHELSKFFFLVKYWARYLEHLPGILDHVFET